jgi:hypothetical protein
LLPLPILLLCGWRCFAPLRYKIHGQNWYVREKDAHLISYKFWYVDGGYQTAEIFHNVAAVDEYSCNIVKAGCSFPPDFPACSLLTLMCLVKKTNTITYGAEEEIQKVTNDWDRCKNALKKGEGAKNGWVKLPRDGSLNAMWVSGARSTTVGWMARRGMRWYLWRRRRCDVVDVREMLSFLCEAGR